MSGTPLIIGHRGASLHAPENTLAAFRLALEVGADGVEFDVRLAKDGVPVVIHDSDLKRTALRNEQVADLTSKELGEIDVGTWFNKQHPQKDDPAWANETIPTLAEVLQLLKTSHGPIYIELKCDRSTLKPLTTAVCAVIRDSLMLPRMIVKSFELFAIAEIRHDLPEVQTAALFEPSIMTVFHRRQYMIATAHEFGAHQISIHYSLVTKRLAALAAAAQMPVTIWTADDAKWVNRCQELGVGALITNDPAKLVAARIQ